MAKNLNELVTQKCDFFCHFSLAITKAHEFIRRGWLKLEEEGAIKDYLQ